MSDFTAMLLSLSIDYATIALSVAFLLAFYRLVAGPSLADRVVALDLFAMISVGVISVYDLATEQPVLLDVATVLALVGFLGTVAYAHYVGRKGSHA